MRVQIATSHTDHAAAHAGLRTAHDDNALRPEDTRSRFARTRRQPQDVSADSGAPNASWTPFAAVLANQSAINKDPATLKPKRKPRQQR